LQAGGSTLAAQNVTAVREVLEQRGYRAGRFALGLQVCNDAAPGGVPSDALCAADARAYAANRSVVGVLGPPNTGCTQVELPIANRAPRGPLAVVGYDSTYVGLTHSGAGTAAGEPSKYFPSGTRGYVRVIAADDRQGAADAVVAHELGAARLFVLGDLEPYGDGLAAAFARASRHLGAAVRTAEWNYEAKSYAPLVAEAARARPDAVFLGTFLVPQSVELIRELRAALPARTRLIAPDGFPPRELATEVGPAAEGMTASVPGLATSDLPLAGRRFLARLRERIGPVVPADSSAAVAQATEVLLGAIVRSDGTRRSVVRQLFRTRVENSILGSFGFDPNGDITSAPITIYRIVHGRPTIYRIVSPEAALLR
jgi:branched-chain amino acid transport system substrate-binding protein